MNEVHDNDVLWSYYNVNDIIRRMKAQTEAFRPLGRNERIIWLRQNEDAVESLESEYGGFLHSQHGHESDFREVVDSELRRELKGTVRRWYNVVEAALCRLQDGMMEVSR